MSSHWIEPDDTCNCEACKITRKRFEEKTALRELMITVEYLRFACEHAEGKNKQSREMLTRAMSTGIRINEKYKNLIDDYQLESYWHDVHAIPGKVGLEVNT